MSHPTGLENINLKEIHFRCSPVLESRLSPATYLPFLKRQLLESSRLKEFADDNSKFEENGRKFSKTVEITVGKREISPFPTG